MIALADKSTASFVLSTTIPPFVFKSAAKVTVLSVTAVVMPSPPVKVRVPPVAKESVAVPSDTVKVLVTVPKERAPFPSVFRN